MMTKVSFIIVAYNAEKCLGALLDDLLAQTLAPRQLEVLLVDSASSDGTRQMMCDFSKRAPFSVKVLDNPKRWLASGINIALQAAWMRTHASRRISSKKMSVRWKTARISSAAAYAAQNRKATGKP